MLLLEELAYIFHVSFAFPVLGDFLWAVNVLYETIGHLQRCTIDSTLKVQKGCDQLDFFFWNLAVKVCPTLWLTFYANYLEHFCVLIRSCIYDHIYYLLDSTCSEHCKKSNLALQLCTRSWQGHWGISELSVGVGSIQILMGSVCVHW